MASSDIRNDSGEGIDYSFHPGIRPEQLVVLGHGVTGNKDRPLLVGVAEGLAAKGWPCLRFSFSGNGNSEGKFEESCISKGIGDLGAVLGALPPDVSVAYIGHSMGAAVGVLRAAHDLRIRALVSLAGMTHTGDFVKREFGEVTPGAGCMWEDEDCPLSQAFVDDLSGLGNTLAAAASVTQPWLLIHGTADDVVPLQDSLDLLDVPGVEKQLVRIPDAGHVFDPATIPAVVDEIDRWLKQNLR